MMIDLSTVFAGGAGALIVFGLLRGYSMWKRWSNNSKLNEEIDIDKLISDAIKSGNTELIAKLRKYFLTYGKKKYDGGIMDWKENEKNDPA